MKSVQSSLDIITDVAYLHQTCEEVDMSDKELVNKLKESLIECFNKHNGEMKGLAAIQIGLPYCAILVRYKKGGTPAILFNPKVGLTTGKVDSNEGCESEVGRYIVKRPALANVTYYTPDGKMHKEVLNHAKARVFCHEYDHTRGILLQDIGRRA